MTTLLSLLMVPKVWSQLFKRRDSASVNCAKCLASYRNAVCLLIVTKVLSSYVAVSIH